MTIVNLQGKLNCKFQVMYAFSDKPQRPNHKDRWPASADENLDRLTDAGIPMNRFIPKCRRCDELGHTSIKCPQEAMESTERVQVQCFNCKYLRRYCMTRLIIAVGDEVGHRVRDCPNERTWGNPRPPKECRHCQSTEHLAKDCPQGPPPMTCRNCNLLNPSAQRRC